MRPAAKRRPLVLPQGRAQSDINVTPLVDVVLVLLIIFMVVTPLAQADLPLELPHTSAAEGPSQPGEAQVVVHLDAAGGLSIDGVPTPAQAYVPRLRELLSARPAARRHLFFQAEDGVNYAVLVAAMDSARAAGAQALEVVTDPAP